MRQKQAGGRALTLCVNRGDEADAGRAGCTSRHIDERSRTKSDWKTLTYRVRPLPHSDRQSELSPVGFEPTPFRNTELLAPMPIRWQKPLSRGYTLAQEWMATFV